MVKILSRGRRTPDLLVALAVIPLCSHQFPVPAQNRIRSHDRRYLLEHLPPEDLAFDCQTASLVISEQDTFLAELVSEHVILGSKVLDYFLLSMIDPAGQDQEQQMPGLQKELHVSRNAT